MASRWLGGIDCRTQRGCHDPGPVLAVGYRLMGRPRASPRRAVPLGWRAGTLLTATAGLGYIAVCWITGQVGDALAERVPYPAWVIPDPGEIAADIMRSINAGPSEELLLFVLPIALGARLSR
jgi:hypothetical protein